MSACGRLTSAARRVKTLALINGFQGLFELLVAVVVILAVLYGPSFWQLFQFVENFEGGFEPSTPDPSFATFRLLGWVVAGYGLAVFITACLRLTAAISSRKLRCRSRGITSLIAGGISIFTIICAPTAIGLLIWGLLVYSNEEVKQAFANH